MQIFPAIDLISGNCVRLTLGDFAKVKVYHTDPLEMLEHLAKIGANLVHVVDLDGAKSGHIMQLELLKAMAQNKSVKIQVGGGIRSMNDIHTLLNLGVNRVILGSICTTNKDLVKQMFQEFGSDKLVLAFDCMVNDNTPILKTNGWQNDSGINLWEMLDFYSEIKYLLCTDISVDGTLKGPNLYLYQEIKKLYPNLKIIASGGVGTNEDLISLQKLNLYGVVVGKAIYEGKVDISRFLSC